MGVFDGQARMMKNSSLLRWTNNKNNNNKNNSKNANKNWLHPPEALQKGHIAYLVKFLGSTEVDQPKGIEVVKEGIRKLKFNQQLKKAEGSKTPKVELTVSIDGVAIHEPKTKRNLHQYPLHRISYCADDKAEKRFFSFIAKEADSDKHTCFVFVSDKLAEEFPKNLEPDVDEYMKKNNISDLLTLNGESSTDPSPSELLASSSTLTPPPVPPRNAMKQEDDTSFLGDILSTPMTLNGAGDNANDDDDDFNPRAEEFPSVNGISTGSINNGDSSENPDDDFDPRAEEKKPPSFATVPAPDTNGLAKAPPALIPPPRPSRAHEQQNGLSDDIFDTPADPFGSVAFTPANNNNDVLAQFMEMKAGFSRGLSFGTADDDFTLESLDPLKN
ncbi:PTB domain-containing engulfment adapter protein 1-like [Penaeus monodon]|uniref:PTB domain-containing engulfment adapter protein 1-like n=1 Tax=Penaeus monodon TaxID=6687 RepID=UPI0018A7275C|nr:PTB domain-containing engulfment adapter protein 1-like [Penaeus monodon]